MNWKLLQKYLSEGCSAEEKKRVERWLAEDPKNKRFLHSLEKIWKVEPKDEINVDGETAWESFQHKISDEEEVTQDTPIINLQNFNNKTRNRRKSSRAVAGMLSLAAVILVTVLMYNFLPQIITPADDKLAQQEATVQEIITRKGQRTSFRLMDGTKVKLNADSKIEIPPAFGDSVRRVNLEGEAYFDVAHNPNKPFTVHSGNAYTRVLGTRFGVKAYTGDDINVVVEEGKVSLGSLSDSDVESQPITKNKRGSISKEGITRVTEISDISKYLGWKDGRLIFESVSLSRVMTQLERWYNIEIHLVDQSLASHNITASFEDEPMTEVLNIITLSVDANYKIEGRNITIHSN